MKYFSNKPKAFEHEGHSSSLPGHIYVQVARGARATYGQQDPNRMASLGGPLSVFYVSSNPIFPK